MVGRYRFALSKESNEVIIKISHLVMHSSYDTRQPTEHKTAWNHKFASFFTPVKPTEPLYMFLRRIGFYLEYEVETFVCAIIYLERCMAEKKREQINPLTTQNNRVHLRYLNSFNAYRLLMVAILIAQKLWCDDFFNNSSMSQVYEDFITNRELNALEVAFIKNIKFNLWISNSQFNHYTEMLGLAAYPLPRLPVLSAEDERVLEHLQELVEFSHEYLGLIDTHVASTDSDDESNASEYGSNQNRLAVTDKNNPFTVTLPPASPMQPRPITHSRSMLFFNSPEVSPEASPVADVISPVSEAFHPTTWMFQSR
jgi:hypothetical protein